MFNMSTVMSKGKPIKTYSLRRIPAGMWQKLRVRAMQEGISVQDLFLRWIQQYAEGK
jgi:DNA polymerase III gamma/tau subunit